MRRIYGVFRCHSPSPYKRTHTAIAPLSPNCYSKKEKKTKIRRDADARFIAFDNMRTGPQRRHNVRSIHAQADAL